MPLSTTHKDRLPSHLSYPVGLQTLANELADIPQADVLQVWFLAHEGSAVQAKARRKSGDHYPVLAARFHHYRLGISECRSMPSLYEPTWKLVVFAVSREKRAVARRLLFEQGIPEIAAWLKAPRSETWLAGKKEITASFSDGQETLVVEERAEGAR